MNIKIRFAGVAFLWLASVYSASSLFAAPADQRITSFSSRAQGGSGTYAITSGFIVGPGDPKPFLIRAIGPGLIGHSGLASGLTDPQLALYNSAGALVASNDDWLSADASTFAGVGAFALQPGSKDAALVATLAPGAYTAQLIGKGTDINYAMLEVYDVSGPARLANITTRSHVGPGLGTLSSTLTVASGGARKLLIRGAGPALAGFGVTGALANPALAVLDSTRTQIAANNDWTTGNDLLTITTAFTDAGAYSFAQDSKDAALLINLNPGTYTVLLSGVAQSSGIAQVEVYDLTPQTGATVSVAATKVSTDTFGGAPAVFTLTRTGSSTDPLTVNFTFGGSAVEGTDFDSVPHSVTIAAGAVSAPVPISAKPGGGNGASSQTLTLSVAAGTGYTLGATTSANVSLFFSPGSLYVANLRPGADAKSSPAYGTATILLSPDETYAIVKVSFSNLSSPEIVAHVAVGSPTESGTFVQGLPLGQVDGTTWTFKTSGAYTAADLVNALKSGNIYVSVDTANFPGGELRGQFIRNTGSSDFSPPAPPPTLPGGPLTTQSAARFLTQATFGYTPGDVSALISSGIPAWISSQMGVPVSLQRTETMADYVAFPPSATATVPTGANRQSAWWKIAVKGNDQLRQRVSFALSELFVISDVNSTINAWQEGAANYYDVLSNGAFGNFRTLLEQVTLNPMMGIYLSHLRNAKATSPTGAQPDENYAREVMQLFTIGLNLLQPDGTLKLNTKGEPIPTYDQTTVTQMAKVFTGWGFFSTAAVPSFRGAPADYINPMMLYPAFHDLTAKTIVTGKVLPANQTGTQDLKDALDTLFNHPNTAPFVSKQLIQRLVTSNPSPGYVYRVAQVFANNGAGVRGDLGAVVTAILTDYEARSPDLLANAGFGKLKEPLIRVTELLRGLGGSASNGRYGITNPEGALSQAALRSPTVFNFFEPSFVVPGDLAAAGLYGPEFEILTDSTAITGPNLLYQYVYSSPSTTSPGTITLDLTPLLPLAKTPGPLIEYLNQTLAAGSLSQASKDRITLALSRVPASTSDTERVRTTIYLIATTPEGAVQR